QFGAENQRFVLGSLLVRGLADQSTHRVSYWMSDKTDRGTTDRTFLELGTSSARIGRKGPLFPLIMSNPYIRLGDGGEYAVRYVCRLIPCWLVVLPLTLLSASLLLSKGRLSATERAMPTSNR